MASNYFVCILKLIQKVPVFLIPVEPLNTNRQTNKKISEMNSLLMNTSVCHSEHEMHP